MALDNKKEYTMEFIADAKMMQLSFTVKLENLSSGKLFKITHNKVII